MLDSTREKVAVMFDGIQYSSMRNGVKHVIHSLRAHMDTSDDDWFLADAVNAFNISNRTMGKGHLYDHFPSLVPTHWLRAVPKHFTHMMMTNREYSTASRNQFYLNHPHDDDEPRVFDCLTESVLPEPTVCSSRQAMHMCWKPGNRREGLSLAHLSTWWRQPEETRCSQGTSLPDAQPCWDRLHNGGDK